MMLAATQAISAGVLMPEIVLTLAGCAALLAGLSSRETPRRSVPWLALVAVVVAIILIRVPQMLSGGAQSEIISAGGFRFDAFADFVRIASLTMAVLIILASASQPIDSER